MSNSVFALGNHSEAERGWREALQLTMETQGTFVALEAFFGMATLRAKQGSLEEALELALIIRNHPATLPETKDRADHLRDGLEAQLTPQQIGIVQARAGERTLEMVAQDMLR